MAGLAHRVIAVVKRLGRSCGTCGHAADMAKPTRITQLNMGG